VIPIPCLKDNYAYLVVCDDTQMAGVVDPAEAGVVLRAVDIEGVTLRAVFNTHHHPDHVGGVPELVKAIPNLEVYGHRVDKNRIDGFTRGVEMGDVLSLGNLKIEVIHNPGHTTGGVTYLVEGCAFTGDTLFGGGCGRLFEGTPETLFHSLTKVLGRLPDTTQVFFGHEYTEQNLKFAAQLEPDNEWIHQRLKQVEDTRKRGGITTPSTLALEWATNPFMRCGNLEFIHRVQARDPTVEGRPEEVFTAIRKWKDRF